MIQVKHIKKVAILLLMLVTTLTLVACTTKTNIPYGEISDKEYLTVGNTSISEKDLYDNLRRQSASTVNALIQDKIFAGYIGQANKLLNTENAKEDSVEKWAQKSFDELVNQAIFSTTNVESIFKMKDDDRNLLVVQYVDKLYISKDKSIRQEKIDKINDYLDPVKHNEDEDLNEFAVGYYIGEENNFFRDEYMLDLQKRLFAEEKLKIESVDKKHDNYITESQEVNYYTSNVKGRQDTNVFYFHFLTTAEANSALRTASVKYNSYGDWFRIPDVRVVGFNEPGDDGQDSFIKALRDAGITDDDLLASDKDPALTKVTEFQFKKFHEAYTPNINNSTALEAEDILQEFVNLYNLVNIGNELVLNITGSVEEGFNYELVYESGKEFDGVKTYEEMTKANSTLANYIYGTLTKEKPYSTFRSVGNYRYLVFELSPRDEELNYVSETKDDDNNSKWVTLAELREIANSVSTLKADEKAKLQFIKALIALGVVTDPTIISKVNDGTITPSSDFNDTFVDWKEDGKLGELMAANKAEWKDKLFRSKVTSAYATSKLNEILSDKKLYSVEIYDQIIRALYNQSAALAAKGKNKSGNDVIKVKIKLKDGENFGLVTEFTITADELYALLEESFGVTTAIDEAVNDLLLEEYAKTDNGLFGKLSKDDKINEKDFNKEYKTLIKNFSSDQFAQAGYPASIGREAFLLLMFGTTDKKEAIQNGFLVPKLREVYTSNIDVTDNPKTVYETITKYSGILFDKFKGVTVDHLLVFYDIDGDGTPDDPKDYLEGWSTEEKLAHYELIVELHTEILDTLEKKSGDLQKDLNEIVTEFQEAARIDLIFASQGKEGDTSPWTKYRKAGLNIKFENIGSEITNTSNFITNQSTLDKVFYDRAIKLQEYVQAAIDEAEESDEELTDGGLPYFDFGRDTVGNILGVMPGDNLLTVLTNENADNKESITSSFGYHFILVNKVSEKSKATYNADKDREESYKIEYNGEKYNVYNENEDGKITLSQIEYYVYGNKLDEGLRMPGDVKSAFTKYYDPIMELYNNQYMKAAMFFKYISDNTPKFTSDANLEIFNNLKQINKLQFSNYLLGHDSNYDEIYATWFADFNL